MSPNIFFTSDTHYHHANIIRYCSRPFSSVEEMNEVLITNHNAIVKPGDTIYNLGDVAFCDYDQFINLSNRLNGQKHIILGNHDKMIRKSRKKILETGVIQTIQDYKELKHDDQLIVMLHYGLRVWNKSHRGSIHIYGHSHSNLPPIGKSVDVGVDCKEITDEYRPIHIDELLTYMSKRDIYQADHHKVEHDS